MCGAGAVPVPARGGSAGNNAAVPAGGGRRGAAGELRQKRRALFAARPRTLRAQGLGADPGKRRREAVGDKGAPGVSGL